MKKIAIIPPNGELISQDVFIDRFEQFLKNYNIKLFIILLSKTIPDKGFNYILVDNIEDIQKLNKKEKFDLIIHRCWMHRYYFASKFINKFDNLVFYIKDWMDEIPREKYKFLYSTDDDYDGIRKIFLSKHKILSHYSKKYTNKLAKRYNISKEKFIFFPEYCNEENFIENNKRIFNSDIKLVYAGGVENSNSPMEISENKIFFDTFEKLVNQKIFIDIILLKKNYNKIYDNTSHYSDFLFLDKFNPYFNLIQGNKLDATLLEGYKFGILFSLEYNKNGLAEKSSRYSVVSKLAFYMEAGIPILINKKWTALYSLIKKYNIGIAINNNDINHLNNRLTLSNRDYHKLLNNVKKFRKLFIYNESILNSLL